MPKFTNDGLTFEILPLVATEGQNGDTGLMAYSPGAGSFPIEMALHRPRSTVECFAQVSDIPRL